MTNQKFVDFDYQRYLDGEEVFCKDGEKFRGEIFYSKIRQIPLVVIWETGKQTTHYKDGREVTDHKNNIYMLPRNKKLWIMIRKKADMVKKNHWTSRAYADKAEVLHILNGTPNGSEEYHLAEVEIEEETIKSCLKLSIPQANILMSALADFMEGE